MARGQIDPRARHIPLEESPASPSLKPARVNPLVGLAGHPARWNRNFAVFSRVEPPEIQIDPGPGRIPWPGVLPIPPELNLLENPAFPLPNSKIALKSEK